MCNKNDVQINLKLLDNEVPDLRESIGWDRHDCYFPQLLDKTLFWAGVRNNEGRLAAFAYLTGPGMPHGYLEDVIVHPDCQGKGIGTALVHRILQEASDRRIGIVTVSYEPKKAEFYHRCGFSPSGGGVWVRP
jgi:GNAT superfamily N-acetyltransferase